ncbi:MAG: biphenyl 2,3-dioxygenase [Actinobacteria bacterium]|nr:biphenyl 2,3-dioxygenase [Actinomycetota bacterium]
MSKRILATVIVAVALAGCGSSSKKSASPTTTAGGPPAAATIVLKNISFNPKDVSVKVGDTVEWKWDDGAVAHNVSGPDFKSSVQTKGTFRHTFAAPGEVKFECTLHPGMTGTVHVA